MADTMELLAKALKSGARALRARGTWVPIITAVLGTLALVPGAGEWDQPRLTRLAHTLAQAIGLPIEETVTTALAEHRAVPLAEGRELVLNSATTVHIRTSRQGQEIRVENGEVLLDAEKGGAKVVRTTVGAVALDMTQGKFSLRQQSSGLQTLRVFSGAVTMVSYASSRYSSDARDGTFLPMHLMAGRAADIWPGRVVLSSFDVGRGGRLLAWRQGRLTFDNESIAEAVAEFNRYNRQQLAIVDPALARIRVGGSFRTTNVDGFVRALKDSFGVRARAIRPGGRRASVIVLRGSKGGRGRDRGG